MPATTMQGQNATATFAALQRHFGFSDARLAEHTGYSRSQIEQRRKGLAKIDVDDLARVSAFYGLPIDVLIGSPDDAIRYVLDHRITLDDIERNNYGRRWRPTLIDGGSDQPKGRSSRTQCPQAGRRLRVA